MEMERSRPYTSHYEAIELSDRRLRENEKAFSAQRVDGELRQAS